MTQLARRIDPPLRLLVVDDEPSFHDLVRPYLRDYQIDHAYNAVQAMATLDAAGPFDIVLLDLGLPGSNGFELLTAIKTRFPTQPVIVVTGYASYELAHEAGKRGASLFCDKCLETYKRLNALIARTLAPATTSTPPPISNASAADLGDLAGLEHSQLPAILEQVALARRLAPTATAAIIEGEAAVGKLDLARFIHRSSPRAEEALSVVNARGVAEAVLADLLIGPGAGSEPGELARVRTGTLVIRGIEELPTRIQRRIANECIRHGGPLLIVTSRRHLDDELAAGSIAPELWDLVRQLVISLPPLRARRHDIADLVEATTASWASRLGVQRPGYQHSVLRVLVAYDWPGNLAEMSDLVARLVGHWSGETIAIEQLPPDYFLPIARILLGQSDAPPDPAEGEEAVLYRRARDHFERYFIRLIVSRHHGDKREAARTLGISYRTLCDKLRADPDGWASDS